MFTLTDTIAEKISQLLATATKQPALADGYDPRYSCGSTCQGNCGGSCRSTCTNTCQQACKSTFL